jgi:hypothetical protein
MGILKQRVKALFFQPARLCIVWRNKTKPHGIRWARYRDKIPDGREYEVFEHDYAAGWVMVTRLTVVDGRRKCAAA